MCACVGVRCYVGGEVLGGVVFYKHLVNLQFKFGRTRLMSVMFYGDLIASGGVLVH